MYINGEFMRAMMWGFCCRKPSEGQYSYGPRQQAQLQRRSRCVSGWLFSLRPGSLYHDWRVSHRPGSLCHGWLVSLRPGSLCHSAWRFSLISLLCSVSSVVCSQNLMLAMYCKSKTWRGYVKFINKNKMYGALCPLNSNLGLHKVAPLLKSKYLNVI